VTNIAIPDSQSSCTTEVSFPVKATTAISGYPWFTEAFGIKIIGTQAAKSKLSHVATVLAELLDNDNDGCVDDPNIMNAMLKQMKDTNKNFAIFVQSEDLDSINFNLLNQAKIQLVQFLQPFEIKPECTNSGTFTGSCVDATQEEMFHVITSLGHKAAYPEVFGLAFNLKSTLQLAMDKARGGRFQTVPRRKSGYPANAWYTYTDTTCDYKCQVTEYIWWGFCSYTGLCQGLDGVSSFKNEFKYLKKSDLLVYDKDLAKFFLTSADKTASFRLPTSAANGKYTGCSKCLRSKEISYDGSFYAGKPTFLS